MENNTPSDPNAPTLMSDSDFDRDGGLTIGIGAKNCLYTLRSEWNEQFRISAGDGLPCEVGTRRRSVHLRNLGKDWAEVVERLPTILAESGYSGGVRIFVPGHCDGKLDPNKSPDAKFIPTEVIPFGQYVGRTISEIMEKDSRYLLWLAEGYHPNEERARGRWMAYLRDVLSDELAQRAEVRRLEKAALERQKVANQTRFKELADIVKASPGPFCESMATKLEKGEPLEGIGDHAIRILADIWSKAHGRRGSKAYNAAWEEFDVKFLTPVIETPAALPAGAMAAMEQRVAELQPKQQSPDGPAVVR